MHKMIHESNILKQIRMHGTPIVRKENLIKNADQTLNDDAMEDPLAAHHNILPA